MTQTPPNNQSINISFPQPYLKAFELVVGSEGGYNNDPRDPGGETKFGISKRAYPELNIPEVTEDQARSIYYLDYYKKVAPEGTEFFMAYPLFDTAVLHGVSSAKKLLLSTTQRKSPNFQEEFLLARALLEQEDRNYSIFRKGWTARLFKVFALSLDAAL